MRKLRWVLLLSGFFLHLSSGWTQVWLEEVEEAPPFPPGKNAKLVKQVKGALTYPAIILAVSGIVVVVMLGYVIFMFGGMFAGMGAALPAPTQVMLDLSGIVRNNMLLIVIAVSAWPPAVSPDGGWRLANEAAGRVAAAVDDAPFALDGIPPFKSADALRFPLEHRGLAPQQMPAAGASGAPAPETAVVVCDPLFADVVGAACDGPAETAWANAHGVTLPLELRLDAGSRRVISVYATP